jgi:hypothetical protein
MTTQLRLIWPTFLEPVRQRIVDGGVQRILHRRRSAGPGHAMQYRLAGYVRGYVAEQRWPVRCRTARVG